MAKTFEGSEAFEVSAEDTLRRVASCALLNEGTFYVGGVEIRSMIADLVTKCNPNFVISLAEQLRAIGLRKTPMFMLLSLGKTNRDAFYALPNIIKRADEIATALSMYWEINGSDAPLAKQLKLALSSSLNSFGEAALAKYKNGDNGITLRDVMFLVHAKPAGTEQARLFKMLADNVLPTPKTWETQLSAGGNKKEVFSNLMSAGSLGGLAFLRNLRNMINAGVDRKQIENYGKSANTWGIFPYSFVSAYRATPALKDMLSEMMTRAIKNLGYSLNGNTHILVDCSSSMNDLMSGKSTSTRFDVAGALAMVVASLSDGYALYKFNKEATFVTGDELSGFDLIEKLGRAYGGTLLGYAISKFSNNSADRLVIITDEQSQDKPDFSLLRNYKFVYVINVAPYEYGVSYEENVVHIDGWSDRVVEFMVSHESMVESH